MDAKYVSEDMRNCICIVFKYILLKIVLLIKGKRKFIEYKLSKHFFNQVIKLLYHYITIIRQINIMYHPV